MEIFQMRPTRLSIAGRWVPAARPHTSATYRRWANFPSAVRSPGTFVSRRSWPAPAMRPSWATVSTRSVIAANPTADAPETWTIPTLSATAGPSARACPAAKNCAKRIWNWPINRRKSFSFRNAAGQTETGSPHSTSNRSASVGASTKKFWKFWIEITNFFKSNKIADSWNTNLQWLACPAAFHRPVDLPRSQWGGPRLRQVRMWEQDLFGQPQGRLSSRSVLRMSSHLLRSVQWTQSRLRDLTEQMPEGSADRVELTHLAILSNNKS